MKINIICPAHDNWIIDRMTKHLLQYAPPDLEVIRNPKPIEEEDCINYYNVYRSFKGKSKNSLDVTFHTHPEINQYYDIAPIVDHIIVMNNQYKTDLINHNIPPDNITVIHPGVDEEFHTLKKLRIFNPVDMSRGERKGPDVWNMLKKLKWIDAVCSNRKLSKTNLLLEYQKADVIVSTSIMEGGPMCVIEGLAMGKIVVVKEDIGLVPDFESPGLLKFKDSKHLILILRAIYKQKEKTAKCVENITWESWANHHYDLFKSIISNQETLNKL